VPTEPGNTGHLPDGGLQAVIRRHESNGPLLQISSLPIPPQHDGLKYHHRSLIAATLNAADGFQHLMTHLANRPNSAILPSQSLLADHQSFEVTA